MNFEPSDVLADRYRILSKLGAGQYGIVYRAHDLTLQKDVALKVLSVDNSKPTALLRFQKEARAAAKLKHVNIVTVYDFRLDEKNNFYLVLEFIEGMSLHSLIENRKALPPEECLHLFLQILNGLAHAHNNGVIHRDLNPSNILVDFKNPHDPIAKIVDFGLAWSPDDDQRLTREGFAVGTPQYMSPEQCHGREADARADIYSFGCVMFECLTGRPPYHDDTAANIILSHINNDAPLISEVRPDIMFPSMLVDIVARALKRAPEERFQSVESLVDALQSIQIEADSHPEVHEQAPAGGHPDAQPQMVPHSGRHRQTMLMFLLLSAVLLGAGCVIAVAFLSGEEKNGVSKPELSAKESNADIESKRVSANAKILASVDRKGGGVPSALILSAISGADDGVDPSDFVRANVIIPADGQFDVLSKTDEELAILEKEEYRNLTAIRLKTAINVRGPGLVHLKGMPLQSLEISNAEVTDDSLVEYLPLLPRLRRFYLVDCERVNCKKLSELVDRMPALVALGIGRTGLGDDALKQVLAFKNLEAINLSRCKKLTGATLDILTQLRYLTEINLHGRSIQARYLSKLAGLKSLDTLILNDIECRRNDLEFLSNSNIKGLYLINSRVDDDCLEMIGRDRTLDTVSLDGCKGFSASGLKHLARAGIANLDFSNQGLTPEIVSVLASWKNLKVLKVKSNDLTRIYAVKILQNKTLRSFIADTEVMSFQDLKYLRLLNPRCDIRSQRR